MEIGQETSKEASASKAPGTHDGKPNFSGIWQALNTANWDIEPHSAQPGPKQFGALFSIPGGGVWLKAARFRTNLTR